MQADDESSSSRDHGFDEEEIIDYSKPVEIIYQDRVRQWLSETSAASRDLSATNTFAPKSQHYLALKESARCVANVDAGPDGISGCFAFLPFSKLKRRSM